MKIVFMASGTIKSSLSYRPISLAKELVKNGHEVYILAPKFDKYSKFKDEKMTEMNGVKIIRPLQIKNVPFEIGLLGYMFSSMILINKIKPDLVHIFKANPITITGTLQKLIGNARIVIDIDDLNSEVMKIEGNSKLKVKLVEWSEAIATKYSDGVTVASKYLEADLVSRHLNKPIMHIPNGADFKHIKKINTKKIFDNKVIFVGNLNRINILEPLIYTIRQCKDRKIKVQVNIIGSGKYLNYFKKLAKKINVYGDIKFLGQVNHDELYKHIKTGDIGYAYMPDEPTIRACSSMKVFEYMQYGAAPLVSNVGDFPLYTYHGKAGYIAKPNDTTSLMKVMISALSNKSVKQEKIKYAIQHASKDYQWSKLTKKVDSLYKKII